MVERGKPTVILDFDGVINSYRSGWQGANVINDPPVEGIKEAIDRIRKRYRVVVVSTRCYHEGGMEGIRAYLERYGIAVDEVTGKKPPAVVTVDDRAITFDGEATTLMDRIEHFVPWHHRGG